MNPQEEEAIKLILKVRMTKLKMKIISCQGKMASRKMKISKTKINNPKVIIVRMRMTKFLNKLIKTKDRMSKLLVVIINLKMKVIKIKIKGTLLIKNKLGIVIVRLTCLRMAVVSQKMDSLVKLTKIPKQMISRGINPHPSLSFRLLCFLELYYCIP
jgi:hypothetical protein